MNEVSTAETPVNLPVGYRLEFRPGNLCFYSVEDFARETCKSGAEIRCLYSTPQLGYQTDPEAYRGRFWHSAKHYPNNKALDPDAVPLYLGPVVTEDNSK